MKTLLVEMIVNVSGGMNLCGDRESTNIEDRRPGAENYVYEQPVAHSRDAGCPGSPMGPSDAPGTGFAGA
jgi:hypothetical protein